MDQESAFLAAIRDRPFDSLPRLALADWLEERGDGRGAFVRLQVERNRYQPWDARTLALTVELDRLPAEHGLDGWRAAPHGGGLLATDALPGEEATPAGAWLTDLTLESDELGAGGPLSQVLHRPGAWSFPLVWVRSRDKANYAPNEVVEALADADTSALRFLEIDWFCTMATAEAWRRANLGSLHGLSLPANTLSARGLSEAVLENPTIAGVRSLTLGRDSDWDGFTGWLAASPCWQGLETFRLVDGILSKQAARKLMKALAATQVRHLAWFWAGGHLDSPVPFFKGCRRLPLESLTLVHAYCSPEALACLQQRSLVALDLRDSNCRNEGVAALLGQASLPRLSILSLAGNRITGPGIRDLAGSDLLARLSVLDLSDNGHPGRSGWLTLFASDRVTGLESLSLRNCRLDDTLVTALAGSPHLGRLQALDLGDNPLTQEGLRALADAAGLPALRYLLLRNSAVEEEVLAALRARYRVVVT